MRYWQDRLAVIYKLLSVTVFICVLISCSKKEEIVIDQSKGRITKIIAHRGFWKAEGACDNSIKAAEAAVSIGADGIELDVWITQDDSIVVNHDATYAGLDILDSSYSDLAGNPLPNGERLPTIRDFLLLMKDYPKTELFIEVKASRAVNRLVEILKEERVKNPVKFISFSKRVCDQVLSLDPGFHVEPLRCWDDNYSASILADEGYGGLAFESLFYHSNPSVIEDACNNNLTLSSWLVNTTVEYDWFWGKGFRYVITDDPVPLLDLTRSSLQYWKQ